MPACGKFQAVVIRASAGSKEDQALALAGADRVAGAAGIATLLAGFAGGGS